MFNIGDYKNITGPMTTANSAAEGRLKVDAAGMKRKKIKEAIKASKSDGKGGKGMSNKNC